jgi:hypothetical protein
VVPFCCPPRGGREVLSDERMAALHSLMEAPVPDTLRLAYPEVYDVTDPAGPWGKVQEGAVVLPPAAPASLLFMSEGGVYLLDNGRSLVLWAGRGADPGLLVQVGGAAWGPGGWGGQGRGGAGRMEAGGEDQQWLLVRGREGGLGGRADGERQWRVQQVWGGSHRARTWAERRSHRAAGACGCCAVGPCAARTPAASHDCTGMAAQEVNVYLHHVFIP